MLIIYFFTDRIILKCLYITGSRFDDVIFKKSDLFIFNFGLGNYCGVL